MIRFGTGGWRALIGEDFIKSNVKLVAAAVGDILLEDNEAQRGILIGYDRRFLSEQSCKWAAETIAQRGVHCRVLDMDAPTPIIMFAVQEYKLNWGMAITASHNPSTYNGIKLFVKDGRDADEAVTKRVEKRIAMLEAGVHICETEAAFDALVEKGTIEIVHPFNPYIDSILKQIDVHAVSNARMRVVIDPMFGVGAAALQTVLFTARCRADVIHERKDALFGGRLPAPSERTLLSLQNTVQEKSYDVGLATDGDADRLGVVDENGHFVHPNKVLAILYYYLLKYKGWRGAAVRNLATTQLLDAIAQDFGEKCYEVPVGFKYISAKMEETNALIGGESSGGLTVRGHIKGKDGIYAAALIVELIAATGKHLSEFYAEIENKYGHYTMEERQYTLTDAQKKQLEKKVFADYALPQFSAHIKSVSYLDGCKVCFENGWIICRFSGTEPVLRIFCEMPAKAMAEKKIGEFEEFLSIK